MASSEINMLGTMIRFHRVDTVLDVGANVGQFATELRNRGFHGRIVSFEPLPAEHAQLTAAAAADPDWEVAPRAALGAQAGTVAIHVSGNSISSSLLAMEPAHLRAAPESQYLSTVETPLVRLDTHALPYLQPQSRCLLKIDVQGYEDRVLAGASGMLDHVEGIYLELSLVPLYEGQLLFDAMRRDIEALGFDLWGLWPGFTDPASGRVLQVNGCFFRGDRMAFSPA
jgi:FkbM family methyltransferase